MPPRSGDAGGARPLSDELIEQFIRDGFVKIEEAFSRTVADAGRAILWGDTGLDPNDRRTWTKPVTRLGLYGQQPFAEAANAPVLRGAFDQLVGRGRWLPRLNLGTFPVRFPSPTIPGTPAGTSTSASEKRTRTSCRGGRMSPREVARY